MVALLGSWLYLLGSWTALGCQPRDPTPQGRGARIFQRTCAGCHGADGRGTLRPGLSKPPRDLTQPEFQAQWSNEQLRQSIRIGKNQMPAFGGLMGEEEIADVIAFIRTLAPPGSVPPRVMGAPSPAALASPPTTARGVAPP